MQKIPVILNSRNRLSYLKQMVDWLKVNPIVNLIILDSGSTYPPLLDYYKTLDCRVVMLGKNYGHTALYSWGGHYNLNSQYFIYSDPDLMPREDCPKDLIQHLLALKKEHFLFNKIGVMLETSDIPNYYKHKSEVLRIHKNYCHNRFKNCFVSHVDTTFAMYDIEREAGKAHLKRECLITDRPYVLRHLPWYVDTNNLSEEDKYYASTADATYTVAGKTINVGYWTQLVRQELK